MKNRIYWLIALLLLPYILYQTILLIQPESLNGTELPNDSEPVVFKDSINKKIVVLSPKIQRIQYYTEPGNFEKASFYGSLDALKANIRTENAITYYCPSGITDNQLPQDNNCIPAHLTEVQLKKNVKVNLGYRMVGITLMKASFIQKGEQILPHNIPVLKQPAYIYIIKILLTMFIIGLFTSYIQFHRLIRQKIEERNQTKK